MRKTLILASTAIALAFFSGPVLAQSDSDPGKVEVGVHFTSITKPDFDGGNTEAGFGGRFTFNFNRSFAVEAEGNFFPHNCGTCISENVGTLTQAFAGVKGGKRWSKFGIFGKARPGLASFSGGNFDIRLIQSLPGSFPVFDIDRSRATNFAFDVGGVIELYVSRRIFTRFDGGDTIIRYSERTFNSFTIDPVTFVAIPITSIRPAETRHNFQFSAGIGIRF
ncbi:MAG TPA: outer membrane beta-barrel protein [Pyrinomonadaceae bacterium]|nr:outer membrane beta-barrel protein [Pyrinomonadaceae bacterium]